MVQLESSHILVWLCPFHFPAPYPQFNSRFLTWNTVFTGFVSIPDKEIYWSSQPSAPTSKAYNTAEVLLIVTNINDILSYLVKSASFCWSRDLILCFPSVQLGILPPFLWFHYWGIKRALSFHPKSNRRFSVLVSNIEIVSLNCATAICWLILY